MKKCRYCQSEIDKKAKICPNCRKKQISPVRKIIGAILIVVGICLIISQCANIGESVKELENSKFELTGDRGYSDEYGVAYYIEGTVKNKTSKTYSYVQVTFNVYDESGSVIGSCLDNINNFEGNGTWKIEAICSGDAKSVKSYKLTGFDSW